MKCTEIRSKEMCSWKKVTEAFREILKRQRQKQLCVNRDEIRHFEKEAAQLMKQLKDDQVKYTDEVKTWVIQLTGERDVSAAKAGKVIQTVTSHLTGNKLELAELPNKTTALRFADISHALTKIQIFKCSIKS